LGKLMSGAAEVPPVAARATRGLGLGLGLGAVNYADSQQFDRG